MHCWNLCMQFGLHVPLGVFLMLLYPDVERSLTDNAGYILLSHLLLAKRFEARVYLIVCALIGTPCNV